LRRAYWGRAPRGRVVPRRPPRPRRGFHVPHQGGAVGVGASSTPGSWCPRATRDPGCSLAEGSLTSALDPLIAVWVSHRFRRPHLTEPRRRLTRVHPSDLPLARSARMARARLGHSPLLSSTPLPGHPLGWGLTRTLVRVQDSSPVTTPLERPRVAQTADEYTIRVLTIPRFFRHAIAARRGQCEVAGQRVATKRWVETAVGRAVPWL
jgi:hypothetical protein